MRSALILATFLTTALPFLLPAQVDYRHYQSEVKQQAGRGTCTAFAVCGMLETFSGVPSDLSEQHLYAEVKSRVFVDSGMVYGGEFLKEYIPTLTTWGVIEEAALPYNPQNVVWKEGPEWQQQLKSENGGTKLYDLLEGFPAYGKYKVPAGGLVYMDAAQAQRPARIKALLDQGTKAIAVGYTVYTPVWFGINSLDNVIRLGQVAQVRDGDKNMGYEIAKLKYADLEGKLTRGELELLPIDPDTNQYGGHAVLIVGYTDKGFIIKNSWGTDWGNAGYGIIEYDYHRWLCREGLTVHLAEATDPWQHEHAENLRLKSLPETLDGQLKLQLSLVVDGKGKMPEFKSLWYEVFQDPEQFPNGDAPAPKILLVLLSPLSKPSGWPIYMPIQDPSESFLVKLHYETTSGEAGEYIYSHVRWANLEYRP